ncbi:MAG: methylmalonyl-CoA mutase, partial [Bacteroidia bacterium]|nr:methylmalonyl-CoA mutase [Bacteroidia bacterium]
VNAIEAGYIQNEIASSAYKFQREVENNESVVVGVNKYETEGSEVGELLTIDDNIRKVQMDKINQLKDDRDSEKAKRCLIAVERAAKEDTNLMPQIIEAVESHCTLGEISDVLREVYGEYKG